MNPSWFVSFCCRSEANKYSPEELMLMKTQDMGYILQKLQSEKKVDECFYCKTHGWSIVFVKFSRRFWLWNSMVQCRKLKSWRPCCTLLMINNQIDMFTMLKTGLNLLSHNSYLDAFLFLLFSIWLLNGCCLWLSISVGGEMVEGWGFGMTHGVRIKYWRNC